MKRIGMDIREFTGKMTGIGNFLYTFLKTMGKKESSRYGFEFILFGNQHTIIPEDINYHFVMVREILPFYTDQISLLCAIEKYNLDLFFSPYPKIPVFSKVKKISSIFDLTYLILGQYKNKIKNKIYSYLLLNLYIRNSDKIITLSKNSKKDIINNFQVSSEKISVVSLCIGENYFQADNEGINSIKKKYNLTKKYILYIGNSNPHKNLNRLIECYNILPDNIREEYHLVLGGIGGYKPDNIKNIDKKYSPVLLRYIPNDDLPKLYSGAELFVFPSLYEGFGLPPLEAMACGCPVVSSNTSSMPEVLGDACAYFNPYDVKEMRYKIEEVLANQNLKNELKQRGLDRAKLFKPESTTEQLLNIFGEIINK